jgi:radical SAM family uncharacterized protein
VIDFTLFQKPQRYIGNEWNVIKKTHDNKITFCLGYPDSYEIGMSNLGLRIVYGLLNSDPDALCERLFMPGADLAGYLEKEDKPLFSLETKTPVKDFDIIGFHMGHELNYTNFLKMLELSKIELFADKRQKQTVIASAIANPEPLAMFVDVFFLGEFEESSQIFLDTIKNHKSKEKRLEALSRIEGFYVPGLYESRLIDNQYRLIRKNTQAGFPVKRVYTKDFENAFVPVNWLTPYTSITHDRVPIEIARGCPSHCTFCQARSVYFPYRQRSPDRILSVMKEIYARSGYDQFSLLGLSTSQHSQIHEIVDSCGKFCQKNRIGLSLPSIRVDDVIGPLHSKLKKLRKISLTVAVESANTKLRESLNKQIDIGKLFEAADAIKSLGGRQIKLYFMFGFPGESNKELFEISALIASLLARSRLNITASINIFIPKPFSRWESMPLQSQAIINEKKEILSASLPRKKSLKFTLGSYHRSFLETILSRGDRKVGEAIHRAYKSGALYDAYGEHFSWRIWQKAIEDSGIDTTDYTTKKYDNFPWSFIGSGGCNGC